MNNNHQLLQNVFGYQPKNLPPQVAPQIPMAAPPVIPEPLPPPPPMTVRDTITPETAASIQTILWNNPNNQQKPMSEPNKMQMTEQKDKEKGWGKTS